MQINGVNFSHHDNQAIFIIEDFSDQLQEIIRTELSSICHGVSDASSGRKTYQYKATLKEFIKRYATKAPDTKIGMIGELISHILFLKYFESFDTVSPYFNNEERSIKKGFDIILYNTTNQEIWITEVKSGHKHQDKDSNQTIYDLLGTAKCDLKERLNENNAALWKNAIVGVKTVLENFNDKKEAVKNILENIQDEVSSKRSISNDKNVILVSTLFNTLNDQVIHLTPETFAKKLKSEALFKNEIVIAIQKETYKRIEDFLYKEDSINDE